MGATMRMPRLVGILAALACVTGTITAAAQSAAPQSLDITTNANTVCVNGLLDPGRLLSWYYFTHPSTYGKDFTSPENLGDAFRGKLILTANQAKDVKQISGEVAGQLHLLTNASLDEGAFLGGTAANPQIKCSARGAATQPVQVAHAAPGATPSTAKAPAAAPVEPAPPKTAGASTPEAEPGLFSLSNFRVRGTPDALSPPNNSDDPLYAAATGATLSFSENGTTHTTSNALQTAVGYDFHLPRTGIWQVDVIPFAAVDRNITVVSSKQAASSRENVTAGLVGTVTTPPRRIGPEIGSAVVTGVADHLWNDINNSQLNYFQLIAQPVLPPILNAYQFVPCCSTPLNETWFRASILLDLRADLGYYNDRGLTPATARDYEQFGTSFGLAISLENYLKSDFVVTETYLAQAEQTRKAISLFQASWTYPIIGKDVGLKVSYQNGNIETTAQRVQEWLISLSAKF
jgi:hypothetical protein